ncbi:sigma-54-dependent Fis family transcriptional regulator [Rariglobus hedericola]|uniref:Sigma-54-dependent Fis family transcriptional regulator n=1 Tax=Rariglobus hedericola TaxID=2597822 RepID=A0A556QLP4_9BACT|nr:sigma-54-dependent Fis family transcriptional regulator [Rariglobus hedericola]
MTVLMIGDEARSRRLLAFGLVGETDVVTCIESPAALEALSSLNPFCVVLLDWEMKSTAGSDMLAMLRTLDAEIPVVATVAGESVATVAQKRGANRCILKPFSTEDLKSLLKETAREPLPVVAPAPKTPEVEESTGEPTAEETASPVAFGSQSQPMRQVLQIALRVAPTSANILILGENGTGKTALARGIHQRSLRKRMPFVTVNCPCLQSQLLQSELFGHVRGSFTGAINDAVGKVAAAEGGTLFLDEIGELPLEIQPKLLRLLQDRQYERVGETKTRQANIRVLAATNRDLREEVKAGRFREDLFYRLNVITLDMPSLRRRPEDILSLAEEFLREVTRNSGLRKNRAFTPEARQVLMQHRWPGNLRELRNMVERAAILSDSDHLDVADFPIFCEEGQSGIPQVGDLISLAELEEAHIREVIARTQTLGHAAEILGINQATLYRKRKRLPGSVETFAVPEAI